MLRTLSPAIETSLDIVACTLLSSQTWTNEVKPGKQGTPMDNSTNRCESRQKLRGNRAEIGTSDLLSDGMLDSLVRRLRESQGLTSKESKDCKYNTRQSGYVD